MKRILLFIIPVLLLSQDIYASILVGKTEGTFSVSPSGAATYTIPITIQKGLSDFSPQISLSYNSQAGNGIAGLGWSISGLSAISVVPKNLYFDGQAEALDCGEDNAFTLDGMRLLLTSGSNGQLGATYRTENEQYNIISITNSSHGTPATFEVMSTDGSVYKYGSSSGRYTLSNGEIYNWALDYAEDVLGNYISYAYSQEGVLYPTSITYGRNTHGTNGVDCEIVFNYESRPDSVSSYILGFQSYLKKRLKSIVCKYNGNTYRTYTLNYSEDTFSRLTSVTESGTSSSTLRPTTFEWNIPEFQVNCNSCSLETALQENPDNEFFFSGDLDGDGITEIISLFQRSEPNGNGYSPYNVFWGRKWNPNSQRFEFCYSEQTQMGFNMGDLGIESMYKTLHFGGIAMHVNHHDGNSLVFPFCQIDDIKALKLAFLQEGWTYSIPMKGMSEEMPPYIIFDADRNGLDDVFIIEKERYNGKYPAYLASCNLTTGSHSFTEIRLDLQGVPDMVRCADFNSDGMADLLITTTGGYYIYWNKSGSFSDSDRYYGTAFGRCDILEVGDFNGDGLSDLIINDYHSAVWHVAINTGTTSGGYFALNYISYLSQLGAQYVVGKDNEFYCIAGDIDGDGRSDAAVGYPQENGDGGHICILRSIGNSLTPYSLHDFLNSGSYPDMTHIVGGNMDGQGGMEIMYYGKALDGNAIGWHLLKNSSIQASSQKMVSITDGLGANDSISYGLLTDSEVYNVTQHHSFPLIRMAGSLPVVTSRKESISSDSRTTNYSYSNGILHLQGKGFLGFEDIRTESSTGIVTETHSELDSTFYVLLPRSVIQRNQSGTQIRRDYTSVVLQGVGSHSYRTDQTAHSMMKPIEGFGETEVNYDYESGFPTLCMKEDDNFYEEKEINYWQSPLNSVWLKGLPEEINITKSGDWIVGNDIYEKIVYERDPSTGQVLKETRTRNGLPVSTDGYSYNEYGQITQHYTVRFNSTDTLVSRYEYNAKGQLKKEYDPKGLSRTYTYNTLYGTLTSVLDFDGVRTQYSYDGMLRETRRKTPVESVQTTRTMSNYGDGVYYVKENRTGEPIVMTHYDAWERKIAEASYLANGILMYQDYQYLPNGKVGYVSFPHKRTETSTGGTTYTYNDAAQRLTSAIDSNGKTSTWSYDWPCYVVSTIDGVTTMTDYYTPDKVHGVEDASGWVEYYYTADGSIANISGYTSDADYEYDSYGRLIRTTDMNGVIKEYSYDNNGYPYRTTIAGSILETNYDKFGILRSKSWTESGETPHTVNYTYDNRFRLKKEEGDGFRNIYSYDTYGRLTHKQNCILDNQTKYMDISIHYNSDNQIDSTSCYLNCLTDDFGVFERYSYSNGYKVSDVLNDTLVWSLVRQDRWGNTTEERDTLGSTTYSFDDYGNMLSMDRDSYHNISETYTYNILTGNMSSKNNIPLTYDSMNQLTGWGNYNYSYDDNGNITHQPFVGDFAYDDYRVTDMWEDGNLNLDDSLRISYYKSIERPRSIENESYKADFYYDGDGNRFMMKLYEKELGVYRLSFTRYYFAGNVEVTVDTLAHYTYLYYAGGDAYTAPAVMVIDENENSCIYQITRDNLGSVLQYENADFNCYNLSYSPWGVRTHQVGNSITFYRPGENPSFGPFCRTYTGHEDLWMFGLLNANARLYSPYLGRFVSPDPRLNEDGRPLDFNPYVYAKNNPYRYVDRNGELPWLLPFAFGLWGNFYSNFDNMNNAGTFFGSLGISALSAVLSTGIGSGIRVALAGGSFGAGFMGTAGSVSSTGFISRSVTKAAAGFVDGFITSSGNSWVSGSNFAEGLVTGLKVGTACAVINGVIGGIEGGLDALSKGANFWTGVGKFDLNDSYSCSGCLPFDLEIGESTITGKYVGKFEGVNVFETKSFGDIHKNAYRAVTIPERGIIAGKGVFTSGMRPGLAMMQHEFGHILQYSMFPTAYYRVVAPESLASCTFSPSSHDYFWTETWANYLSKGYFGRRWIGGEYGYPASNISTFNLMRMIFAQPLGVMGLIKIL